MILYRSPFFEYWLGRNAPWSYVFEIVLIVLVAGGVLYVLATIGGAAPPPPE